MKADFRISHNKLAVIQQMRSDALGTRKMWSLPRTSSLKAQGWNSEATHMLTTHVSQQGEDGGREDRTNRKLNRFIQRHLDPSLFRSDMLQYNGDNGKATHVCT